MRNVFVSGLVRRAVQKLATKMRAVTAGQSPAPQPRPVLARVYPPVDLPADTTARRVVRVVHGPGDDVFYGEL